jgi:hypothetical protein
MNCRRGSTSGGNYLYLWKKDGGQWKVGLWMWNWHEES